MGTNLMHTAEEKIQLASYEGHGWGMRVRLRYEGKEMRGMVGCMRGRVGDMRGMQ